MFPSGSGHAVMQRMRSENALTNTPPADKWAVSVDVAWQKRLPEEVSNHTIGAP